MRRQIIYIITSLVVVLAITTVFIGLKPRYTEHQTVVTLAHTDFTVSVADTPASRKQGLSGRSQLDPHQGMLFVFPASGIYGFWMKEMQFPLDIIWIGIDRKIVHIEESLSPETYPTVFYATTSAQYVLEISAGQSRELGIKIGDVVSFSKK